MSQEWDDWVLDATGSDGKPPYCWCPIEPDGTVVTGMNWLSDEPPGSIVGVVHAEGQEAVEAWCEEHPEVIRRFSGTEGEE